MRVWFSAVLQEDMPCDPWEIIERFAKSLARRLQIQQYDTNISCLLFFPSIVDERRHYDFGDNFRRYRRALNELHVVQRIDYEKWCASDTSGRFDLVARCLSTVIAETNDDLLPASDKKQLAGAVEATRLAVRDEPITAK